MFWLLTAFASPALRSTVSADDPSPLNESISFASPPVNLRKCCPWDEILMNNKCRKHTETLNWNQLLYQANDSIFENIRNMENATVVVRKCSTYFWVPEPERDSSFKYHISANGTIRSADYHINTTDFCLEFIVENSSTLPLICENTIPTSTLLSSEPDAVSVAVDVRYCTVEKPHDKALLLSVGFALSSIFLCFTFLIYAVIRELRNLQGKCLMLYVLCLIVGESFMFVMYYFIGSSCVLCVLTGIYFMG